MDKNKINEVVSTIVNAKNLVALTGAGVSTESGIPDFRSPESGLWTKTNPILFTKWGFRIRPKALYKLGQQLFTNIWDAEPAIPHKLLALLEKKGILKGVITQNIDNLHQKAGSKRVIEVHGHLRSGTCIKCKKVYIMEEILAKLNEKGQLPPRCDDCKKTIKPDVVLFGDPLPTSVYQEAIDLVMNCTLLLILGSSLVVHPAAGLPGLALKNGAEIMIVNLQPTPYDRYAHVVVNRPLGGFCQEILDRIESL